MKKKMILSIAFLISLLPMLFNQYGGLKGVQEITGLINLLNPIGMVSVILFVLGVWFSFITVTPLSWMFLGGKREVVLMPSLLVNHKISNHHYQRNGQSYIKLGEC